MKSGEKLTAVALSELAKKYNDREIGDMYCMSAKAVWARRKRNGIPAKQKAGAIRTFNPAREDLHRMYQTMTMGEIAKHLGVGETAVWNRIKEYGIKFDADPENGHRRKPGFVVPEHMLKSLKEAGKRRRGKYVGENNPNWKGGISGASSHGRSRADYIDWKRGVLDAADNKCQSCGIENGHFCDCCGQTVRLHAHHIKSYKAHPEVRYDVSNGKALCPSCHHKEHY